MKLYRYVLFVILTLILVGILFTRPARVPAPAMSVYGSDTVRGQVVDIIEDGEIDLGGVVQRYQVARVELLEGKYQDVVFEMDLGKRQILPNIEYLETGDKIIVSLGERPDGMLTIYFVDFIRTNSLILLTFTFAIAIILISRWKGFRSLLSMAFSLYVIIGYIIPRILSGEDPLQVSIVGSIILLSVTLYLTYGWNLKTHAAVVSMILVLFITGLLAGFFVAFTRLTGSGDETSLFLLQMLNAQINLRGLLLGGMIIGALGVLDDLVTTQASAVFELHRANPSFGFQELYESAMRIGQDHVAATVNTLVLAYAGASLPMLLLFTLGQGDLGYLVNFELVAEEIVRTLVGSLGLVSAVPLTTTIAIVFALKADSLGRWEQVLGPVGGGEHHVH